MERVEDCGGSMLTDNDQQECVRHYMMYVPNIVCDFDNKRGGDNSVEGGRVGILPIWMAVHCLGCSPSTFYYLAELAERRSMILVIPEGIHQSFNADRCCGYALEQNVNDVGFLEEIIKTLHIDYANTVHRSVTYGMGWSNGGYMVMKAASLFRAIAPIAGYQVDLPTSESDQLQHHLPPTSLFLHHSADDRFVQPTGCCTDPTMPKCCCHLSDYSEECLSVNAQVETWARTINRCDSGTDNLENGNDVIVSLRIEDNVECRTFVSDSCQANTTYCIYQHKGHFNQPSFEESFPMSFEVADYFARDACGLGGGRWDDSMKTCQCPSKPTATQSPYCLDASTLPKGKTSNDADGGPGSNSLSLAKVLPSQNSSLVASERIMTFLVLSTIALAAIFVALSYWKRKRRYADAGFEKVPTSSSTLEMRSY